MLDIKKYDSESVSIEEIKQDDKIQMTVTMEVKESQAVALQEFFKCWNSLASMGSSRMVSFYVDGDGDFKPNCQISFSKEPEVLSLPEEQLKFILNGARISKDGEEPIAYDYDSVAWRMRTLKFKYTCVENTFDNIKKGYYLGVQKGYTVDVPDVGTFKIETGIRGTIPVWCHITPEVIAVHQQKYNDAIDGYQPYDWEEEKYLPFEKFENYDGKTVNGPAEQ